MTISRPRYHQCGPSDQARTVSTYRHIVLSPGETRNTSSTEVLCEIKSVFSYLFCTTDRLHPPPPPHRPAHLVPDRGDTTKQNAMPPAGRVCHQSQPVAWAGKLRVRPAERSEILQTAVCRSRYCEGQPRVGPLHVCESSAEN